MNNIAIAAGHDETADTALEILRVGGNAIDAAIAAFMTSFIAEPGMSSGGGGAFANVFTSGGENLIFDFFSQTPSRKRPLQEIDFFPIEVDFGTAIEEFHVGMGAIGVPGSIAGIFAMHQQLGSMPMRDLAQPAIQLAKEGVVINEFQHYDLQLLEQIFRIDPRAQIFFKDDKVLEVGDKLFMPELADFLDYMASEGKDAFYKGEVAGKIIKANKENGGFLRKEDLENYKVIIRKALQFKHNNKTVLTNPLPSTGGALIALLLGHLDADDIGHHLSKKYLHRFYDAYTKIARLGKDPAHLSQALYYLLSGPNNKRGSTTHFGIVDQWGNAVSLTTTSGEGCGYFVEGTQIHMNNMLGEAALVPNGFHSWQNNVRLSSMMAPTIMLDQMGRLDTIIGSGGASRIPSAIAQVIHLIHDQQIPLKKAVNAPRVHLEHGVFNVEYGFDENFHLNIKDELKRWDRKSLFFGGVHTITKENNTFIAAGDNRRDGVARGY